jgi:hypothetical protein
LTSRSFLNKVSSMSLAQLKDQAAHLDLSEQRELIPFLISRQTALDEDFKGVLAAKIDDADPAHWVELDELRKCCSGLQQAS